MSGMDVPSFGSETVDFRYKKPATISKQRGIASRRGTAFVGMSPSVVITGITAISASFLEAASHAQNQSITVTDVAAGAIFAAQKRTRSFRNVTGDTRRSITNTVEARYNGYARSVGPEFPAAGPPVARFLIFGTVKMSSKWDFFGKAQPYIETWQTDMDRIARVI